MDNENKYNAYQYGKTGDENHNDEIIEVNFTMRDPDPEPEMEEMEEIEKIEEMGDTGAAEEVVYEEQYRYEDTAPKQNDSFEGKKKQGKKQKKAKKWVSCIALAMVFGLVASVVFQVSNRVINNVFGEEETNKVVNTTTPIAATADVKVLSDVSEVAEKVMPSVVSITSLTVQEVQSYFFGSGYTQEYESSGSGIIIGQNDDELLIVTNNHVVEDSSALTVTFSNDTSVEAQIKGTDADSDLAIVAVPLSSIEDDTMDAIKIANLGDSDALVVGEPTIAIGNALGYGQSVTNGIVSALNRTIEGFDTKLIQTNAAINPGNSGGALLNAAGEVIGINTVKVNADAVEGMGYAIPISDVEEILSELMSKETRTKVEEDKQGTIGIQGVSVDENASQMYGMPEGVQVREVIKGGAADKAGLQKGCIITKFDGTSIGSMDDLLGVLEYYEAGEKVEITVEIYNSNGEYVEKTYELTLGEQSDLD